MKAEIKKLWVEALRSGKYKQNFGSLKCGDSYCVLGVLADLCPNTTWTNNDGLTAKTYGGLPLRNSLLGEVYQWIGDKYYSCTYSFHKLVEKNDFNKLDFNELADYIEVNIN